MRREPSREAPESRSRLTKNRKAVHGKIKSALVWTCSVEARFYRRCARSPHKIRVKTHLYVGLAVLNFSPLEWTSKHIECPPVPSG